MHELIITKEKAKKLKKFAKDAGILIDKFDKASVCHLFTSTRNPIVKYIAREGDVSYGEHRGGYIVLRPEGLQETVVKLRLPASQVVENLLLITLLQITVNCVFTLDTEPLGHDCYDNNEYISSFLQKNLNFLLGKGAASFKVIQNDNYQFKLQLVSYVSFYKSDRWKASR